MLRPLVVVSVLLAAGPAAAQRAADRAPAQDPQGGAQVCDEVALGRMIAQGLSDSVIAGLCSNYTPLGPQAGPAPGDGQPATAPAQAEDEAPEGFGLFDEGGPGAPADAAPATGPEGVWFVERRRIGCQTDQPPDFIGRTPCTEFNFDEFDLTAVFLHTRVVDGVFGGYETDLSAVCRRGDPVGQVVFGNNVFETNEVIQTGFRTRTIGQRMTYDPAQDVWSGRMVVVIEEPQRSSGTGFYQTVFEYEAIFTRNEC